MNTELLNLFDDHTGAALSPIVIFNGPPGSGKDEAFTQLDPVLSCQLFSTSEDLKLATIAAFGLRGVTVADLEKTKNEPNPLLGGLTWREAQVRVAENLKKNDGFGPRFWTESLIRRIKKNDQELIAQNAFSLYIVTGMGFPVEMSCFENDETLRRRCLLVRVKREGKTFGKKPGFEDAYGQGTGFDSRNFLFSDSVQEAELDNNLGLREYRHDLLVTLSEFFDLQRFQLERNDRIVQTALISGRLRNTPTEPLKPFAQPYREYAPGELTEPATAA